MPGPTNTLLIEGSFEELADEFAQYLDSLKKSQGDDASAIQSEIGPLLEQGQKEEILKNLVTGSAVLNSAPEKEFVSAYNLLIHLVRQADNINIFLPKICNYLSSPITGSPTNGPGLALSILSTIFNILQPDNESRYHVFLAVVRVVKASGSFDMLRPQLKSLDAWVSQWDVDEEDQRNLFLSLADVAAESGDDEDSYTYLLRALRTIPASDVSSEEAQNLSIRALKHALLSPHTFDFQDLTSLDSIQALRRSHPTHFELLELFNADTVEDYNDFKESHDGWVEEKEFDDATLLRKIRLLTLASVAANTPSRSLPYGTIAHALQVPSEDVEMWVIDVIRAGLVEGKLSQMNQTFLIHRSTYRVFTEKQWHEVAARLDTWRESLRSVLEVVKRERENVLREKERELREIEGKMNGQGMGAGRRPAREAVDTGAD